MGTSRRGHAISARAPRTPHPMRKRKYVALHAPYEGVGTEEESHPPPRCHNIVSTSQLHVSGCENGIDLARMARMFPFTSYDRRRFAAITIRLAQPQCTCLLFGSGKLVITGSTSFYACIVASQSVSRILRQVYPMSSVAVRTCVVQNIVAHVEFPPGTTIDLVCFGLCCGSHLSILTLWPLFSTPLDPLWLTPLSVGRDILQLLRVHDLPEDDLPGAGAPPAAVAHRAAHLQLGAHRVHGGAVVQRHVDGVRQDLPGAQGLHTHAACGGDGRGGRHRPRRRAQQEAAASAPRLSVTVALFMWN
jgi:TATA-box binding protein (TBP) (component of TFIID and TFIIIB)